MNWFHRLCRQTGLMIHDLREPSTKQRIEVSRKVEENSPQPGVTVRRTIIEEVEIREGTDVQAAQDDAGLGPEMEKDNQSRKAYNPES